MSPAADVLVRNTRPDDFDGIVALTRRVYPDSVPWSKEQLSSHLAVFPEGQFVALEDAVIVGMAASLIVLWDDYHFEATWRDFTASGTFKNHDPARGRTLYGAEVMVDPERQGAGIGTALYSARRDLCVRLGLRRIRAGARLAGLAQPPWIAPRARRRPRATAPPIDWAGQARGTASIAAAAIAQDCRRADRRQEIQGRAPRHSRRRGRRR